MWRIVLATKGGLRIYDTKHKQALHVAVSWALSEHAWKFPDEPATQLNAISI